MATGTIIGLGFIVYVLLSVLIFGAIAFKAYINARLMDVTAKKNIDMTAESYMKLVGNVIKQLTTITDDE